MSTALSKPVIKELQYLLHNYPAIELVILLRKLYSSYLRECAESGLPEDFVHESCMMDGLFAMLELAIREKG